MSPAETQNWTLYVDNDEDSPPKLSGILLGDDVSVAAAVKGVLFQFGNARRVSPSLEALLEQLAPARSVLVEHGYFDVDSRSEDAATIERQFRFDRPIGLRFHFFSSAISEEAFRNWQSEGDPELADGEYLGYAIVRSRRRYMSVGRTLVRPMSTDARLLDPDDFANRVRTAVEEEITLYGVTLVAEGVPFMEQDGALTSCGHVTAWMAQYSAVLRNLVPRVPIAALRGALYSNEYGRDYPTHGLVDAQIASALSNGGLAPDLILVEALGAPRHVNWYHRKEVSDAGDSHQWHRENLTATVARYLNSGLPVVLARGHHVVLVCGYLRFTELSGIGDVSDGGAIGAFITHDESDGPYRVEMVSEYLGEDVSDSVVLLPLPSTLALSGDKAEVIGARALDTRSTELLDQADELAKREGGASAVEELQRLRARIEARELGVRTYAALSADLKKSLATRCNGNKEFLEMLRMARMPRLVWVVELIDRAEREQRRDPVIGQVIIDATATSPEDAPVVLVHLPSHVESFDSVTRRSDGAICNPRHFRSGRWARAGNSPWSVGSARARSKTIGVL